MLWCPPPSLAWQSLNINLSSGKKNRKLILTESNETYTECSRLQINVMCQTILEENVYWLGNEHRKIRKSGWAPAPTPGLKLIFCPRGLFPKKEPP